MSQGTVSLLLQFGGEFRIFVLAFSPWAKGSTNLFAKCDCKRTVRNKVGAAIEKVTHYRGFPRSQHLDERHGFDVSPLCDQQFDQLSTLLIDSEQEGTILHVLTWFIAGKQFN